MSVKKSPLEALIEFPKDGPVEARRELLRQNTDALVTAADRYGSRDKEFLDLLFSRATLLMDRKLRRGLAMSMAKSNVDKDRVKTLLSGKDKGISLILRRSTTQTVPDLVNIIRERTTALYNSPRLEAVSIEDLQDGKRFTLPALLLEDTFRFIYFSLRQPSLDYADQNLLSLLDRTATRFRPQIIEESQAEARRELLDVRKQIANRLLHNQLTEDYVAELLMTEHRTEFILAMCSLVNIDNATMQRVLNDSSWESLAICCRAATISRAAFANFVHSMNRRQSDRSTPTRIISLYNTIPADAAERVMRFWQVRATALSESEDRKRRTFRADSETPVKKPDPASFRASERKALFDIA